MVLILSEANPNPNSKSQQNSTVAEQYCYWRRRTLRLLQWGRRTDRSFSPLEKTNRDFVFSVGEEGRSVRLLQWRRRTEKSEPSTASTSAPWLTNGEDDAWAPGTAILRRGGAEGSSRGEIPPGNPSDGSRRYKSQGAQTSKDGEKEEPGPIRSHHFTGDTDQTFNARNQQRQRR
nr:hypothetical protein Iba_chr15bCG7560 [Ipomoea batatas]